MTAFSGKRSLHLLAAVLGSLLIGSLAFSGQLGIANPSGEEQAGRVLEKATKEQPWQNSLGMKFVPVTGTQVLRRDGRNVVARERWLEAARGDMEGSWV